jgi:hypothetical protein
VSLVESQPEQRDVIPTEACRFLPNVTVAEQPSHGDGMTQPRSGALSPDANLDQAVAEFVDRSSGHWLVPRMGDFVKFRGEFDQRVTLLRRNTPVVCEGCGQDLAEFDQVWQVRGLQKLRHVAVVRAKTVDVEAI